MIRARQCLILVFMLTFKEEFGNKSCDLLVGGKSPSGCKPPHSFLKKILINLKHRQPARPLPSVPKKLPKVCFSETTIFSQIHPLPSPANPRKFPINETTTKIKLGGKHVIQLSLHSFHWKQIKFANFYSKNKLFFLYNQLKMQLPIIFLGKKTPNSNSSLFMKELYEWQLWHLLLISQEDYWNKGGNENAKFSWLVPILSLVVTVVNICWKWGQSIFVDQSFHSWDIYLWLNSDIVRRIQCWSLLRL